jgi:hypothetical protein
MVAQLIIMAELTTGTPRGMAATTAPVGGHMDHMGARTIALAITLRRGRMHAGHRLRLLMARKR